MPVFYISKEDAKKYSINNFKIIIMKQSLFFLFTVLCLSLSTSCEKEEEGVVARFLIIGNNSYAPSSIEFKEDNTNAQRFEWIFPDGAIITDRRFSRTFTEAGTFPVKLIVYGYNEEVDSVTNNVIIRETPTKLFVKKVELKSTPMSPSSSPSWDAADGPDIFLKFQGASFSTDVQNNVSEVDFPISWTLAEPYPYFTFNNINKDCFITVYDEDANGDQLMATTGFNIAEFAYKSTIEYDDRYGTELKLTVEWGN